MALKRMSIKVSEEMHDWILKEGEKRGLTMNAVVIFALETYYQQTTILPQIPRMMEELEQGREK